MMCGINLYAKNRLGLMDLTKRYKCVYFGGVLYDDYERLKSLLTQHAHWRGYTGHGRLEIFFS